MTYSIVQQNTGSVTVGAGLTATVTVPAPTTAGNKVLIVCVLHTTGTIASAGFAKDITPSWSLGATYQAPVFSKDTAGGESSWTLTGFGASTEAVLWYAFEVSGLAVGAADKKATDSGTGGLVTTQTTGTTATTTSANELAVAVVVGLLIGGTVTFSGWTNGYVQKASGFVNTDGGGVAASIGIAFAELTSTGTTSSTVTFSGSAYGLGGVATYPESGGSPATSSSRFLAFF